MEMRVAANYSDSEMMRKLIAVAERGCLVTNTLRTALSLTIALEQEQ